jgi:uncharacterized membrane protein HdeD (DUF308 family)
VPKNRALVPVALLAAVLLIVLSVVYFVEPAKSLPSWIPGYQAGSTHHHVKHGIASLFVGLACLVYAWFATGKKQQPAP